MTKPRRRAYYILSSHWDREWHLPFQDFRYRWVRLLDQVLDGLADGRLAGPFTTDGQAIVLEDYLEIRPERRGQVEQFLRKGKIVSGPWYVMPDEFLVSGESLVRNLRLGRELVRSLGGKPSSAGVLLDHFGHNSQMPQLLAGFGAKGILLWRGVNLIHRRHFLWRGADGTQLPVYRFGRMGYCDYSVAVRRIAEPNARFDAARVAKDLEKYLAAEAALTEIEPLLVFDGADHQEWDQACYAVLRRRMDATDGAYEIVHGDLDQYLAEVDSQVDRISEQYSGELRQAGQHPLDQDQMWVIPGVSSSRAWIHQANAQCESLLCHWAEPWSALAHTATGAERPDAYLATAWKWLLQNHPHDSICGCSVDHVHEDMKYRFGQCRHIAERLTTEALRRLAAAAAGDLREGELRLAVFNPLPEPLRQTAEITLEIPDTWPTFNEFFGFEPKPAFRIYDTSGEEVAYQRLAQAMSRAKVRLPADKFPEPYRTHDVTVSLALDIPSCGYTTLSVRPGEPAVPTRHPNQPGMATNDHSMENEFLAVSIETCGTLALTDKRTGYTYRGLLTVEDRADIGDGWFHGMAVNDETWSSAACPAAVALVHDGPMLTSLRIRTRMEVPAEFDFQRMTRSDRMVEMTIESLVSLRPGSEHVEVATTITNPAADHRVRLLMPTGVDAQSYLCDTPFDVVQRPIALAADNHLHRELEVETRPQQTWTAVSDGRRGLAVVSCGMPETAVQDLPERPIALTLFRSTRRTVFTDGEPEGLLIGHKLFFRYLIVPLSGAIDRAGLCRLGQRLAAGLRNVQLTAKDLRTDGGLSQFSSRENGSVSLRSALSRRVGFLRVDGPVVVTSIRQVGDGLEIRLFNPAAESAEAAIHIEPPTAAAPGPTHAQRVDFESHPIGPLLPLVDGDLKATLRAKEISTLRLIDSDPPARPDRQK